MKLVHYSHTGSIKIPSDFLILQNQVFSIWGLSESQRKEGKSVCFFSKPEWGGWTHYGDPHYLEIDPEAIVNVGVGGCFHRLCQLKDADDVLLDIIEQNISSVLDNIRFGEIVVPASWVQL